MQLELWFDFSCPYAYLASRRAPGVARAFGASLVWQPMLLGGVFRGVGAGAGPMATLGLAKAAHNHADMMRWADLFGVPLRVPAGHPMRTVRALRVLLALPHSRWPRAIDELYAAYWQRGDDITGDEAIAAALRRAAIGDDEIAAALARADDFKDELRRRTDRAIELGIFGAPAWVVSAEPGHAADRLVAWGQDRIPWVEAALAGTEEVARPFGDGAQGFASPRTLDVYFDVASPFAYLALTQLPRLAELAGVAPRLRPILLGGLFRAIGQADVPLHAMVPAKRSYVEHEMARWARWWGVPFEAPRKFPQRTVAAQRLCLLAGEDPRLATALGRALWAEQRDLEDHDTLRGVLADCGLPREWVERTREPGLKTALAECTAAAQAAGVFGVPTFVVDGRFVIWGQDRLDLVLRALGGWEPPS
ncbi:MAG TPA: DsbA family protein [Kofleriaceae bacterium]